MSKVPVFYVVIVCKFFTFYAQGETLMWRLAGHDLVSV
jgi:hypothetical protein